MTVVANDTEVRPSAPEAVHTEAETDGTAHKSVHAEQQLASSSEVIIDSDSVYSVCYSDVTSDTADIVHIDHETPPVPGRGMASYLCHHLSLFCLLFPAEIM